MTVALVEALTILERGILSAVIRLPIADLDDFEAQLRAAGPTPGNEAAFEDFVGSMMAVLRATRELDVVIARYREVAGRLDVLAATEATAS